MFKFITTKPFWVNLIVAVVLTALLFFIFFYSLTYITKHGDNLKVPSVTGMNVEEAKKTLKNHGFDVEIQDSVYIDTAAFSSVLRQSPEGNTTVKSGRTVFLSINRAVPPLIEMPDLKGYSYLSAKLYLNSIGLKVGDTSYIPDIAKNAVREQLYKGKTIQPGTKINMSSSIDLVLGSGIGSSEVNVPDLVGMTLSQARDYISNLSIGVSAVIPEGAISDTSGSFVIRQNPLPYTSYPDGSRVNNKIRAGQLMDIWISSKMPAKDDSSSQE